MVLELDPPKAKGRKRVDQRRMLEGIIFRMRSSCQWNHLPKELGDDSTIHRTFQRGVLERVWAVLIEECREGYDNPTGHRAVAEAGYQPHIRRIGEEKLDQSGEKIHPARRWVVERTLGWLSKCRAILVRCDKKASNYLGLLQLACALIWYRPSMEPG